MSDGVFWLLIGALVIAWIAAEEHMQAERARVAKSEGCAEHCRQEYPDEYLHCYEVLCKVSDY